MPKQTRHECALTVLTTGRCVLHPETAAEIEDGDDVLARRTQRNFLAETMLCCSDVN